MIKADDVLNAGPAGGDPPFDGAPTPLSLIPREDGFWYLGTPYSKFPGGLDRAFQAAARLAARLLKSGLTCYCPIAHSHPIAMHGGVDPLDHQIWLPYDEPFMRAARGLIVGMMPSWRESYGLAKEIEHFTKAAKPIFYIEDGA